MGQVKSAVLDGRYRDSVFLMKISGEIGKMPGVKMASAMMSTERNKELFLAAGLMTAEIRQAKSDDLAISLIADTLEQAAAGLEKATAMISADIQEKRKTGCQQAPERLEQAVAQVPGLNLALISVAGEYAAYEAAKALRNRLNVMLYSDNIDIAAERRLKEMARDAGLIVMGPDCGTAIINGVPLAFANTVAPGCIGVVGASGTGMQEVTCLVDRLGQGISQAIGVGGRDLKQEVGGISFLSGFSYLIDHPATKVIVLISKPPHQTVRAKVAELIWKAKKPVVVHYVGNTDYEPELAVGAHPANTLDAAAVLAVELAGGKVPPLLDEVVYQSNLQVGLTKAVGRKYLRGIFGGGTLCYEALDLAGQVLDRASLHSNIPLAGMQKLIDLAQSQQHTFLDMGEDEFTVGKPHPMIDPTSKHKRLLTEMNDPAVAVVLFDLVIGFGAYADQAAELAESIRTGVTPEHRPCLIASVTGTESDSPRRSDQIQKLQAAGVLVMPSNALAARLACDIMQTLERSQR